MKSLGKWLSLALALVLSLVLTAPALAAAVTYEAVSMADPVTLTNYLVTESTATVLSYTFSFTLTPAEPAEGSKVKQGPQSADAAYPKLRDAVTVNASTAALSAAQAEAIAAMLPAGFDAATHSVYAVPITLDFTGVTFDRPGVYRYILTLDDTNAIPGMTYDANRSRYVDVYVQNGETEGTLTVAGTVLHTAVEGEAPDFTYNTDADTPGMTVAKRTVYVHELDTVTLTLTKDILGNQADFDAFFDFTVAVSLPAGAADADADCTFPIVAEGDATKVAGATAITTAYDAATDQYTGSGTVQLSKGGTVKVKGLPVGTVVTVTEDSGLYTAQYTVGGGAPADGVTTGAQTMNADLAVAFTNTLTGVIPTGVLLTVAPFAALMLVGLIGVLVFLKKRHND